MSEDSGPPRPFYPIERWIEARNKYRAAVAQKQEESASPARLRAMQVQRTAGNDPMAQDQPEAGSGPHNLQPESQGETPPRPA